MNLLRTRLVAQQLLAPSFATPQQVVGHFGFVQAQEQQMMRWAVGMRTAAPSHAAFRQAFDSGAVVRSHLFRSTWQLCLGSDLGWMVALCRERVERTLLGWARQSGNPITPDDVKRHNNLLCQLLEGRPSTTKAQLVAMLREHGASEPANVLQVKMAMAEACGLVTSGHLDAAQNTWALVSEKLGELARPGAGEAMAWLARRYFGSHGAATVDDFAWWTGLPRTHCARAVSDIAGELVAERWRGETFLVHDSVAAAATAARGGIVLLPAYDEFLIGYKSRHLALDKEHSHHAYNNYGIFRNVVLKGGRVVGNWSRGHGGVTMIGGEPELPKAPLARAWQRYNSFWDEKNSSANG